MRKTQKYSLDVRNLALTLRKKGYSYREIREKLQKYNIPKNTLSYWVTKAKILLTNEQLQRIRKTQQHLLIEAHRKGGAWNRNQKLKRLEAARDDAGYFLKEHSPLHSTNIFFLSGLYLGEGSKCDEALQFANSNPRIIQCFLSIFRKSFPILESKFGIQIHLRFDQDEDELKKYWSQITHIPLEKFQKVHKDVRTTKSKTYSNYKGVCAIYYYDAKIQRFMLELQKQYIESVLTI